MRHNILRSLINLTNIHNKHITSRITVDFKADKKHAKPSPFLVDRLFITWLMILLSVP